MHFIKKIRAFHIIFTKFIYANKERSGNLSSWKATIGKNKKIIVKCILLLLVIIGLTYIVDVATQKQYQHLLQDKTWLDNQITLQADENGVYYVETKADISIFNTAYQEVITEKINDLYQTLQPDFENMLLIYNPYGTGSLSYNIYYEATENTTISYTIQCDGYSDFSQTLTDSGGTYQLIGFIAGKTNHVTITETDENQMTKTVTLDIVVPALEHEVDMQLEVTSGDSTESLRDGLYAVLGHDKNEAANIYFYDNEGILRQELILDSYRADRIIFANDCLYYAYSDHEIAKVDDLGQIEQIYTLDDYIMHHDMVYDQDQLVILASENGADTIEDLVITLDLTTGEINKIIDMKNLLPEFYLTAVKPEGGNLMEAKNLIGFI